MGGIVMGKVLDYYTKHGKGRKLKELLSNTVLKKEYPEAMNFFSEIKSIDDSKKGKFSGKLLMFTKNNEFKKHVNNIIKPLKINFPSSNINDIDGRIEYTEKLFLELKSKVSKTEYKKEDRFQMLLMYIAKVYNINIKLRGQIKRRVESQRMAGDTLKTLHDNFKNVEPLIRSDFEKIFKSSMDKSGYEFCIKSQGSIAAKIHMAQERFFKGQGYTDLQACKKSVIDAIRYTVLYSVEAYVTNFNQHLRLLEQEGYKCIRCKNFWKDEGSYNGVNALFSTPYGYFVEVQFHTNESKNLNLATHKLYEDMRNPETSEEKRQEIREKMRELESEYQNEQELVERIKRIKDFELSEIVWSLPPED